MVEVRQSPFRDGARPSQSSPDVQAARHTTTTSSMTTAQAWVFYKRTDVVDFDVCVDPPPPSVSRSAGCCVQSLCGPVPTRRACGIKAQRGAAAGSVAPTATRHRVTQPGAGLCLIRRFIVIRRRCIPPGTSTTAMGRLYLALPQCMIAFFPDRGSQCGLASTVQPVRQVTAHPREHTRDDGRNPSRSSAIPGIPATSTSARSRLAGATLKVHRQGITLRSGARNDKVRANARYGSPHHSRLQIWLRCFEGADHISANPAQEVWVQARDEVVGPYGQQIAIG